MEIFNNCSVCFHEYTEEARVPKVVECGHSFCDNCLTSILQSQKSCPKCRATLSKDIEEYPTNYDLLGISKSSKENLNLNFLDACTSETMKNELQSNKTILRKLMAERDAITCSIERTTDSMKKLLSCTKIMCEADEIVDVVPDIEDYLEEVNKSLNYRPWETDKDMLRLKDFENSKLFLSEIVRRLQGKKRVYSCTKIDLLGEWKYGKITFRENRLHIHCLSSSVFEKGASLVLLKDVKNCITSRIGIHLFIEFGSQKMSFTLTEDSPFDALWCLKAFTGEEGRTIKGLDSKVYKDTSENLSCDISIPTKTSNRGYEEALYEVKVFEVKEGEVMLQCALNWVCIIKWSKDRKNVFNLVGKLHENCQIDFDKIELENKVIDCGISLNF